MIRTTLHNTIVLLLTLLALALVGPEARAVQPDEVLSDPKLEARAREISAGLRCLVCQNQSIDDSDAPLARDLRLLVRERLKEGDTNTEVRDYLVQRYGEFVLLSPPVSTRTIALWVAPLLILLGAIALAIRTVFATRSNTTQAAQSEPLSEDERAALDQLLPGHEGKDQAAERS